LGGDIFSFLVVFKKYDIETSPYPLQRGIFRSYNSLVKREITALINPPLKGGRGDVFRKINATSIS
jgi:hypothetical protein